MHPRLQELQDYLDAQRRILHAAVDAVPTSLRNQAPQPGAWSVAGVVEHLAIAQHRIAGILSSRIAQARTDGVPADGSAHPILPTIDRSTVLHRSTRVAAADPLQPTGLSAEDAWSELERGTQELRSAMASGDGLDLGMVRHPHPRLGSLSLYEWIAFVGAHEARHAEQIRETGAALAGRITASAVAHQTT